MITTNKKYYQYDPMAGSALGLHSLMVTLMSGQTDTFHNSGATGNLSALNSGFNLAFIGAALLSTVATIISLVSIKDRH
jgi:hypothetical protein